jgi:hypothetical protein
VSSDRAVIPAWVIPDGHAVADAHRISYAAATADSVGARPGVRVRAGGVATAINWVTGGQLAPITERPETDHDVVWAEWLLAGSVETGVPMVWGDVEPREPVIRDRTWAAGVSAALGWLLGVTQRPPVAIPRRLADGSVPTVEQLYRELVAARPHAAWTPEQRSAAWVRATQAVQAYQSLAAPGGHG